MVAISTIDRVLGSLIGSYVGHYYGSNSSCNRHFDWPANINDSSLYQAWLTNIQTLQSPYPYLSTHHPMAALPWLLYHHDNKTTRHHYLAQQTANSSTISNDMPCHLISSLYILGDCLEWLMQCPLEVLELSPLFCEHFKQQQINYPDVIIFELNQWLLWLSHPSAPNFSPGFATSDAPLAPIFLAIWQCLNHPDNLALALGNDKKMSQTTLTTIGCLLGAWGGLSVIPSPWMLLLSQGSRRAITLIAEQIYREWAGIRCIGGTLETLPLNF